jgi:formylmethanofuran dehydrogenase subunit E
MVEERKGRNVVLCDECGELISWSLDSNMKHGYKCTSCIDRDYGKFRVLTINKDELSAYGVNPDKVSDKALKRLADELNAAILLGNFYAEFIAKYVKRNNMESDE